MTYHNPIGASQEEKKSLPLTKQQKPVVAVSAIKSKNIWNIQKYDLA